MPLIQCTANHQDLSSYRGYQFKFCCDKCGNGFVSRFQTSTLGVLAQLMRLAHWVFGHSSWFSGWYASDIERYGERGHAHDAAFEQAVQEARSHFKNCGRCGKWVCPAGCWNSPVGQCSVCAPVFQHDLAAHKAQAMSAAAREQLQDKARQTDYSAGVDMQPAPVQQG